MDGHRPWEYNALNSEEMEKEEREDSDSPHPVRFPHDRPRGPYPRAHIIVGVVAVIITATLSTGLSWLVLKTKGCDSVQIANQHVSYPVNEGVDAPSLFGDCGASPSEAKERGCVYDVMI